MTFAPTVIDPLPAAGRPWRRVAAAALLAGLLVAVAGAAAPAAPPDPAAPDSGPASDVETTRRAEATRVETATETPAATAAALADAARAAAAAERLRRPVLVGASVTAGFNAAVHGERDGRRLRVTVRVADLLEHARRTEGDAVVTHADLGFFRRPDVVGPVLMHRALEDDPTVLVAIDYLFWFAYGHVRPDAGESELDARLARLERGLRLLDRAECPMLVGDLPDMSAAAGLILSHRQVPAPELLERLNERLHAWADERERVTLLPFADLAGRMRRGEPIEIAGHRWSEDAVGRFMQMDRLHPSGLGLSLVAQRVAASMIVGLPAVTAHELDLDAAAVLERHVVSRIGPAASTPRETAVAPNEDEAPAPDGTGTSDSGGRSVAAGAGG